MRGTGPGRWRHACSGAALALALTACGGSDGGAEADASTSSDDATASASDPGATAEPSDGGAAGGGTATVGGATHEFPDVTECEIDGETWGEGWRRFLAWSEDGHDLLDITVANDESEELGVISSVQVYVGTQNARTLDEANPEQEWTTGLGGTVSASISPDGASGTAEVAQASGDSGTVEWSFTC